MPSLLQTLVLLAGIGAAAVAFLAMRYPHLRRTQFRESAPASMRASALVALTLFAIFALLAWLQ